MMDTLIQDVHNLCFRFLDIIEYTFLSTNQLNNELYLNLISIHDRMDLALKHNNYRWIMYLRTKLKLTDYISKAVEHKHDWAIYECMNTSGTHGVFQVLYTYGRFDIIQKYKHLDNSSKSYRLYRESYWDGVHGRAVVNSDNMKEYLHGLAVGNHQQLYVQTFNKTIHPISMLWSSIFNFDDQEFIIEHIKDSYAQMMEGFSRMDEIVFLLFDKSHWKIIELFLSLGDSRDFFLGYLFEADRFDLIQKYYTPGTRTPDDTTTIRYYVKEKDDYKLSIYQKYYKIKISVVRRFLRDLYHLDLKDIVLERKILVNSSFWNIFRREGSIHLIKKALKLSDSVAFLEQMVEYMNSIFQHQNKSFCSTIVQYTKMNINTLWETCHRIGIQDYDHLDQLALIKLLIDHTY